MTQPIYRRGERLAALCKQILPLEAENDLAPEKYREWGDFGYMHSHPPHGAEPTPPGKCHLRFNGISMRPCWSIGFSSEQHTPQETLTGESEVRTSRFLFELRRNLKQGQLLVPRAHVAAVQNIQAEMEYRMAAKRFDQAEP